jgi:hypothetical protein
LLIADFARKLADAGFLIELDCDGFLVVAEKAGKDHRQRLVLP